MDMRRADLIADELEKMIFTGAFTDGDRLDEIRLAGQFSVSRTPIREAFQRLVASGLAVQIPRRGVFVAQPGPVELMEMFETMAEIEAACARLAAMRISDTALVELDEINQECLQAMKAKDIDRYYQENERFHQTIYQQSGNSFLAKEARRLQHRLKPYRRIQLHLRGRMAQSMAEHETIVTALRDGDSLGAADAMRGHVAVQGEKFHHLMSSITKTP
ncbi:GntR family transcriptional regulator [Sedimentitalea todarodis]|uniref:GntR family transcriptional regulator n=1 Tax=Sedimentitalea todarodis TaxID=1631240 RepID=A0ABU3VCM9_9RHOB|nr:GntR family transcriptional regulator [Sedimentitalea todarodis]MDU9003926.1 GntR family transcriptional regulator [Sedimentitalea todarodis]